MILCRSPVARAAIVSADKLSFSSGAARSSTTVDSSDRTIAAVAVPPRSIVASFMQSPPVRSTRERRVPDLWRVRVAPAPARHRDHPSERFRLWLRVSRGIQRCRRRVRRWYVTSPTRPKGSTVPANAEHVRSQTARTFLAGTSTRERSSLHDASHHADLRAAILFLASRGRGTGRCDRLPGVACGRLPTAASARRPSRGRNEN